MARIRCKVFQSIAMVLVFGTAVPVVTRAEPTASEFRLENGLQVAVVEDHRAPVVTHMVWYRVGAADDPPGKSGLAHFVEHLMFKGTSKLATGEFTRVITRLGGRHNALTNHDTTTFFQRLHRSHLERVMQLEADRMANLRFEEAEVATERSVVREERRGSVDGSPIAILNEQILSALYQNHPYRRPVLGWAHEIDRLTLQDAADFYARHYAPNNAVLVVVGDVTSDEVRALAEKTYGRVAARSSIRTPTRPTEPEQKAARSVRIEDDRAPAAPVLLRYYTAPGPGRNADRAALELLALILGGGESSRIYRSLVIERKVAVQGGADYQGLGLDGGRLSLLASAAPGISERELEGALDDLIAQLVAGGVTENELQRAKSAWEAERVFASDNPEQLARRYGQALAIGLTLGDLDGESQRISSVSQTDVQRLAADTLKTAKSATGVLTRPGPGPKAAALNR